MTLSVSQAKIRELSDRLVTAQKPIRILDAIKWGPEVKAAFFASQCQKLPEVNQHYYHAQALSFNMDDKHREFERLQHDIESQLGLSGAGSIMLRMCHEYRRALDLIAARGTPEFSQIAKELYGSSHDRFYPGAPALKDLSLLLTEPLQNLKALRSPEMDDKRYSSEQAAEILGQRLSQYFAGSERPVVVMESDDIVADASAGASSIKMRKNALFSERDLKLLEVHEGWVHVGTSLNGARQPICSFLGKGAPSSTITQEGLAVLTEIFTFSSYPERVQRITHRITGIHMAEEGADFLEVFRYFTAQGLKEEDSYSICSRIFRGSSPHFGPFTKDLSYAKGFLLIYNFIRLAVQQGLSNHIPVLFVGKTALDDVHTLLELMDEGLVVPPKYIPPQFSDLAALSAWMCFSLFMNKLDLSKLSANYKPMLHAP